MGLLNKILGGNHEVKEEKVLPWIPLIELTQLDIIEKKSITKTQLIFKHSTRCWVSKMVMNQFVTAFDQTSNMNLYYLDVISYRSLSRTLASKFEVQHESPQVLMIKNGVVVAHASHGSINDLDFGRFI